MAGSSITAGLAGRYATALFGLAQDEGKLAEVSASLDRLAQAIVESADLARLTTSPLVSRAEAERGVLAAADAMGLDPLTRNFTGVLARARRLAALPAIVRAFRALAADARGATTAEVTSARPLSPEQVAALTATLTRKLRRDVAIDLRVDPEILGGLVVRVGSRLIDSSLRTKLAAVGAAMRG